MTPTNLIIAGLALAVALLTGALGWQTVRLANEKTAHAQTVAGNAKAREDQATAAKADVEKARAEEHRRIFALEGLLHEKAKLVAAARADADASALAVRRLRDKAARYAAAVNKATPDPTAPAASPPAAGPAVVLADVLGSLGERAAALGKLADESRVAGLTCEAAYDSLTKVDK